MSEDLSREGSQKIEDEPCLQVVPRYRRKFHFDPAVRNFIPAEEVYYDIDSEKDIDGVVQDDRWEAFVVDKCDLEGHDSGCVGQKNDDNQVPDGLEPAVGHYDVPGSLIMVLTHVARVHLIGDELTAKQLDLCNDCLLLLEHDGDTDRAIEA